MSSSYHNESSVIVAHSADYQDPASNIMASPVGASSSAAGTGTTNSTQQPAKTSTASESFSQVFLLGKLITKKLGYVYLFFLLQVLTKPRLQELVREIDPTEQLDEEVEELLLQIADDFVENTVNAACLLAKHRKVSKVEVKDVQLHLERNWNMWIPGFGTDELRPYKRASVTEAHKQRLALIRKAIKKY